MRSFLGLDTSNYTTSCAVYIPSRGELFQSKRLLPVKEGELGLRQSDAVFHHTKQLPELFEALMDMLPECSIDVITASVAPRCCEGSYMPCFLVGEGYARVLAGANKCTLYRTSHQTGHVLAALYSADKMELLHKEKPFLAFHVSGGTTDLLLCTPDKESVIKIEQLASSLDLKAGQAIDRVGLMLGLKFPCGKELEKLAEKADKRIPCRITFKDGNCCLSGVENICRKHFENGESRENVAMLCLDLVLKAIKGMTEYALRLHPGSEIVYAGGVMSDKILQTELAKSFDAYFATADFSCDNAAGVALYGAIKEGLI